MDLESRYEISRVAEFIRSEKFNRVALQFPDELLKDSTKVVNALREKLQSCSTAYGYDSNVGLYVMADTTFGSCCVDEVGASHMNADCVIHYGHTCLSPTSNLPALFVFGKAPINASVCARSLCNYALISDKPILVLFGLEYAHARQDIIEASTLESSNLFPSTSRVELHYADALSPVVNPSRDLSNNLGFKGSCAITEDCADANVTEYRIGGLCWSMTEGHLIENYTIFWIGPHNTAFANVVLTFNSCEIVRFDATENILVTDFSQQKRILKRRYYLVEKAKDAGIVGILVGTLGVAGYLHMVNQMKELITRAGKKAYTLVMGRPNPAKLANFPECDIFVYVSCAQTALMDSKEFLAPVITPFEAILAFNRDSHWTGAYVMDFRNLMVPHSEEEIDSTEEARFSFLRGGYVEDSSDLQDAEDKDGNEALALVSATEKALQLHDKGLRSVVNRRPKSGVEYFASRFFQGLEINSNHSVPEHLLTGRSGKASGYDHEKNVG